jgi:hypothetical protein
VSAEKPTPADRIAAALAKREALKAQEAEAFAEQQAADIEALVELEEEHGFDRVLRIDIGGWKPASGAATMVAARVPMGSEKVYKRFQETVAKAKPQSTTTLTAATVLGESCLIYPPKSDAKDLYEATLELAPGILVHVGQQIAKAVEGKAEEEKKG